MFASSDNSARKTFKKRSRERPRDRPGEQNRGRGGPGRAKKRAKTKRKRDKAEQIADEAQQHSEAMGKAQLAMQEAFGCLAAEEEEIA